MYPYKKTLILQEVFNLSFLIQKINVTSERIACFYYYNIKVDIETCLPPIKDNMKLSDPVEIKLLSKLQHAEIYLLSFFKLFTFHVSRKT